MQTYELVIPYSKRHSSQRNLFGRNLDFLNEIWKRAKDCHVPSKLRSRRLVGRCFLAPSPRISGRSRIWTASFTNGFVWNTHFFYYREINMETLPQPFKRAFAPLSPWRTCSSIRLSE